MMNVRCKHGEGVRIGDAFVLVDRFELYEMHKVVLRIQAPPEVQIDILKRDSPYVPEKIVATLKDSGRNKDRYIDTVR